MSSPTDFEANICSGPIQSKFPSTCKCKNQTTGVPRFVASHSSIEPCCKLVRYHQLAPPLARLFNFSLSSKKIQKGSKWLIAWCDKKKTPLTTESGMTSRSESQLEPVTRKISNLAIKQCCNGNRPMATIPAFQSKMATG